MSGFIPPHGGYEHLVSYRKACLIYRATVTFCSRFVDRRDRTRDQMVQAARSGKQNIVEGSIISGTSKEMEIKLMNVARASLEELLEDYRDALRRTDAPLWDKNDRRALFVRNLGRSLDKPHATNTPYAPHASHVTHQTHTTHNSDPDPYDVFRPYIETRSMEIVANILICLIHQANYLLDRQIRSLEKTFLEEGGLRERMTRARLEARRKENL